MSRKIRQTTKLRNGWIPDMMNTTKTTMKAKAFAATGNENGSALLIAVMILALVAVMAATMSRNTTVELQIVRNDTEKRQQFYFAEAAAREAAQEIENQNAAVLADINNLTWVDQADVDLATINLTDARWERSDVDTNPSGTPQVAFTVVDQTGPIDLSAQSNMHAYSILGVYNVTSGMKQGQVLIEIGYRRRF